MTFNRANRMASKTQSSPCTWQDQPMCTFSSACAMDIAPVCPAEESLSAEQTTGAEEVPGQAIIRPIPEVFACGHCWHAGPTSPHSFSLTLCRSLNQYLTQSLTCGLFPSGATQTTKAWSAHCWGDGSEDPAIVRVNVGSPVPFPALPLKPPISTAVCQTTSFLSLRAFCHVALKGMRWQKMRGITKDDIGISLECLLHSS